MLCAKFRENQSNFELINNIKPRNNKIGQLRTTVYPLTSLPYRVVWALTKDSWSRTTMKTWSPYMDQAIKPKNLECGAHSSLEYERKVGQSLISADQCPS